MRITDKFLFFWTGKDIYSNFYYSPFKHQRIMFKWSEQAIMWRKAKLFGADEIARQILLAQTPQECKNLGRSKKIPFDNKIWEENREKIYKEVLLDKFSNSNLKKMLLSTEDKTIAEASPYDTIWGIGLGQDHPFAEHPDKWKGLNLLGKVLMEVREELKES